MDALMDPKAVKTAYRKYVQKFHPDKFESSKDYDKIYITTTVFAAINEQYALFSKEKGIR